MKVLEAKRSVTRRPRENGGGAASPGRPPAAPSVNVVVSDDRRGPRGLLGPVLGIIVIAVLVAVVGNALGFLTIGNPFGSSVVDRTRPLLLRELVDRSRLEVAQATFEVRLDIEEDVDVLPGFIAGERTIFIGIGTVDAWIDLADLDASDVTSDSSGRVTVTIPEPHLARAVVDPGRSYVADRDRGLVDRVVGIFEDEPTSEQDLYRRAAKKIQGAATESQLEERARRNAREVVQRIARALGTEVDVAFEARRGGPRTGS